jgi:hypothetical protein
MPNSSNHKNGKQASIIKLKKKAKKTLTNPPKHSLLLHPTPSLQTPSTPLSIKFKTSSTTTQTSNQPHQDHQPSSDTQQQHRHHHHHHYHPPQNQPPLQKLSQEDSQQD